MNATQTTTSSTITCPGCRHQVVEAMPVDACVVRWTCPSCALTTKPKAGDCCVFCSYADIPCPPVQQNRACCR